MFLEGWFCCGVLMLWLNILVVCLCMKWVLNVKVKILSKIFKVKYFEIFIRYRE